MISLRLSCLRQSLFKQSIRSINATVAACARGRGRFETMNLSKEWLNKNISLKIVQLISNSHQISVKLGIPLGSSQSEIEIQNWKIDSKS